MTCPQCDGGGKLADTEDREPWSAWTSLPLQSAAAVVMGMVRPIECDRCQGSGEIDDETENETPVG